MKTWIRRMSGMNLRKLIFGAVIALVATAAFAGSVTYTYDSLGRLSNVTYSNGVVITYSYDAAGNRTSFVVIGSPT